MENPFIFIFLAFVVVIMVYNHLFSDKVIFKRRLKKATLKKINDFTDNEIARFVGELRYIDEPMKSPLTLRPCAHYYVKVEQKVSSGKSSSWKTIIDKQVTSPFAVVDETGKALVNDARLKSVIVMDQRFDSGLFDDPAPHLKGYLAAHGIESENFLGFNKTIRYTEGILEEGEKIAVLGKGVWQNNEKLDLPFDDEKILTITSSPQEPMYLSDDPDMTNLAEKVKKEKKEKKRTERKYVERKGRYLK